MLILRHGPEKRWWNVVLDLSSNSGAECDVSDSVQRFPSVGAKIMESTCSIPGPLPLDTYFHETQERTCLDFSSVTSPACISNKATRGSQRSLPSGKGATGNEPKLDMQCFIDDNAVEGTINIADWYMPGSYISTSRA